MATQNPSNTGQCQMLVFHGIQNDLACLTLESMDLPAIGQGEILATIRLCAICGSDLHTLSGKRLEPHPSILGHEAVAEVVSAIGREADDISPGDRITFSVADSCGECRCCQDGLPQKCDHLFKYGHALFSDGTGLNGCYASHIVLRKGTTVVKIPDHVTDLVAVSVNCALATMINAISQVTENYSDDRTVVIQGSGLLGLYGCALFRDRGYSRVFCTDIDKLRLDRVPQFGGIPWNSLTDNCTSALPSDNSVDVVVEVCGSPSVIQHGLRLLRPGGTYILVGMVTPDSRLDITGEQIIRKCLTIKGIHNYTGQHLREAVEFLGRTAHIYPYTSLVSEPISLAEFHKAFSLANTRQYPRVVMHTRVGETLVVSE